MWMINNIPTSTHYGDPKAGCMTDELEVAIYVSLSIYLSVSVSIYL